MLQPQPIILHVSIIGGNSLFEECITHLLVEEIGLQVASLKYTDKNTFLKHISIYRPQVIILNESSLAAPISFVEFLFAIYWGTDVRLIIVRDSDCLMDVYDISQQMNPRKPCKPQQFTLSEPNDLLAVIKD